MVTISRAEYERIHPDFRGVWTTERTDIPGWENIRHQYLGKRTLIRDNALLIEGLSLTIVEEGGAQ
ncbi:hypothetical protein KUU78_30890 (plasmid) [Pseudomonas aeruginosa]|uniref:hypothetical protein n=1 Tax=Pseudomonadota TaxID=1224 RepID=UPI0015CECFAF|nr:MULTISPECIES: hypothetical protein [Pseudomonadota]MBY9629158.1 hypothetical protein [Pseudomonas aeruginosa]MBY9844555.1 hypothetical protein [Pseudomonas aeruginosa]MCO8627583.1 hypothetical protein [Burkholderia multivorans]NYS16985.1 hypothetical protein [Achromobacter xylosoxidans]QZV20395.1 hypothetical protein ITG68_30455 [Pseudomonas aeruginosa]